MEKIKKVIQYNFLGCNVIEWEGKLRKWGNSIGLIVPKEKIKGEKLKSNQRVRAIITAVEPLKAREIFGGLRKWTVSTQEILKKTDKELESKFLKG